jgi:hypothetical protein
MGYLAGVRGCDGVDRTLQTLMSLEGVTLGAVAVGLVPIVATKVRESQQPSPSLEGKPI